MRHPNFFPNFFGFPQDLKDISNREFYTEDGENVVLEFSANVSGKSLKGIDMVRFNAQGKIIDFEVMIRPMSGLAALAEKMGARFAQYQPNTSQ